jgi:hypothetical protein
MVSSDSSEENHRKDLLNATRFQKIAKDILLLPDKDINSNKTIQLIAAASFIHKALVHIRDINTNPNPSSNPDPNPSLNHIKYLNPSTTNLINIIAQHEELQMNLIKRQQSINILDLLKQKNLKQKALDASRSIEVRVRGQG